MQENPLVFKLTESWFQGRCDGFVAFGYSMSDGFVINVTDFIWWVDLFRQNQIKGSVSCSELDFNNADVYVHPVRLARVFMQEILYLKDTLYSYYICVVKWII